MSRGRHEHRADFDHFVAQSTGGLLRTAFLVTGDVGLAEDLVQESLFKVARRWSRVRAMDSPGAYARRIVVNLALDGSKRRSRHRAELAGQESAARPEAVPGASQSETSWSAFSAVDQRIELLHALTALAPRQRAALVLRYFDDLSEAEVASMLRCSIGTVKSTTSRALDKMRALVPARDEPVPEVSVLATPQRKAAQP